MSNKLRIAFILLFPKLSCGLLTAPIMHGEREKQYFFPLAFYVFIHCFFTLLEHTSLPAVVTDAVTVTYSSFISLQFSALIAEKVEGDCQQSVSFAVGISEIRQPSRVYYGPTII